MAVYTRRMYMIELVCQKAKHSFLSNLYKGKYLLLYIKIFIPKFLQFY